MVTSKTVLAFFKAKQFYRKGFHHCIKE